MEPSHRSLDYSSCERLNAQQELSSSHDEKPTTQLVTMSNSWAKRSNLMRVPGCRWIVGPIIGSFPKLVDLNVHSNIYSNPYYGDPKKPLIGNSTTRPVSDVEVHRQHATGNLGRLHGCRVCAGRQHEDLKRGKEARILLLLL